MKKWWLVLFSLLSLDILTKILALQHIPPLGYGPYPFGGIPIFSFLGVTCSLNYITNTGAAWGLFSDYSGLLFILRSLIILALLFFVPKKFPLWLVVMGAIGNAIDYCVYGHVIDFIHFTFFDHTFPIFNVADSCITIGVFTLLFYPRKAKQIQPS
jgi:lipoprotein signal peptidase